MDQLRDEFPALANDDCDEPHQELPPTFGQPERRMQARAYSYWAGMLRGRSLPSIFDCDPERSRDFEANTVLLDVSDDAADPAILTLGSKLAEQCGIAAPVARLSDVPKGSLLAAIAERTGQSLASRAPFGFESELINQRGTMILYRGILLPFSTDQQAIDFLICAVNWKEVADPELAAALHREMRRAHDRDTVAPRSDWPLTEWADGPAADLEDGWNSAACNGVEGQMPGAGEASADLTGRARALAAEADAAEQYARALRDAATAAERRAREAGRRSGD